MQQRARWIAGDRFPLVLALSLLAATSGAALCGCAPGENVMTTAAVPTAAGPVRGSAPAMSSSDQADSGNLATTAEQRAYLDALQQAGVHPSSELMALSIGSYVCQAHTAGQGDQAVRDFVLPLVRGDLHDAHPGVAVSSMATQVDDATAAYIRIATDQLC